MATMSNVTVICNPDKLRPLISAFNALGITGITVLRFFFTENKSVWFRVKSTRTSF